MYRIDDADATAVSPFPLPAAVNPQVYFTEGDAGMGIPATRVTAEWLNMVQEEIAQAIIELGGTLDKTNQAQLAALIHGVKSLKSHATDTGIVSTTDLRALIASTSTRATGAAAFAAACIGALLSGGASAALGSEGATVSGDRSAAVASVDPTVGGTGNLAAACFNSEVNTAGGTYSAVVGGSNHDIQEVDDAVILGGTSNIVNNNRAAVMGGNANDVQTANGTICGGDGNTLAAGSTDSHIAGSSNSEIDTSVDSAILGCNGAIVYDAVQGVMLASLNAQHDGTDYAICGGYAVAGITKDTTAPYDQNLSWKIESNGGVYYGTNLAIQAIDFAELFELAERVEHGMLVTFDSKRRIRKAQKGDKVLGVVSAAPGVIAGECLHWHGKYLRDPFGAPVYETHEMVRWEALYEKVLIRPAGRCELDGEPPADAYEVDGRWYWNPLFERRTIREAYDGLMSDRPFELDGTRQLPDDAYQYSVRARKLNPDYDPSRKYTPRGLRPEEWAPVGLTGQVCTRIGPDVAEGDQLCAGRDGLAVSVKGDSGRWGRSVECREITQPYSAELGYGVAVCLVG